MTDGRSCSRLCRCAGVDQRTILRVPFDIAAHEGTAGYHTQLPRSRGVQRRPSEEAAHAAAFERRRHLRVREDDAVARPLIGEEREAAVQVYLEPPRRLVVLDPDAARHGLMLLQR